MAEKEKTKTKKETAKKVEAKAAPRTESGARVGDYSLLLTPVFTEKSSFVGSSTTGKAGPTVVFRVLQNATKEQVKESIERAFNVQVERVRTCSYIGKVKRTMRSIGRRAGFRKAYVTLKQGHSISVVEGL